MLIGLKKQRGSDLSKIIQVFNDISMTRMQEGFFQECSVLLELSRTTPGWAVRGLI
jgi:hypothetical protein